MFHSGGFVLLLLLVVLFVGVLRTCSWVVLVSCLDGFSEPRICVFCWWVPMVAFLGGLVCWVYSVYLFGV